MTHAITVDGGKGIRLKTAGKLCDRDIVVTATDGGCSAKHITHSLSGNGSGSLSFYIPFEPDFLQIISFDPTFYNNRTHALASFTADLRAFGTVAGLSVYSDATGLAKEALYTTKSILNRYSRTADGMVTIQNLVSSLSVVFDAGYQYTVIAVKYTDQTDADRITTFVTGLTGSGTAALNRTKVNAAFTDTQWATLIAAKPDWTFTWI